MVKKDFCFNEFSNLLRNFEKNPNTEDRIRVLLKECTKDELKKIFDIFFRFQKINPHFKTHNILDILHQKIVDFIEEEYHTREEILDFLSGGIVDKKTRNILMEKYTISTSEIESTKRVLAY